MNLGVVVPEDLKVSTVY